MSQLLTIAVVVASLCGCDADSHPTSGDAGPNVMHPVAPTGTGGMQRDRDFSTDPSMPPPDQTTEPTEPIAMPTLSLTHAIMRNRSGRSIWYTSGGCEPGWIRTAPAQPVPESDAEKRALDSIITKVGCACDCTALGAGETCSPRKCGDQAQCTQGMGRIEVKPNESLEQDLVLFTTTLDETRACFGRVPYPPQTEIVASFCWQRSASGDLVCHDMSFHYGDPYVIYVVADPSDEDAGPGDDGGAG